MHQYGIIGRMARSSPQEEKAKTHHRIRCDDILGNGCRAWVQAPTWSHPEHPLPLYPPITPGTLPHDLDAATLDSMVTSRWPWLLQRVAIHPHTSPATLDKLARQANADPLRQAVARNPRCLANTLEVLAKRSNNDALVDGGPPPLSRICSVESGTGCRHGNQIKHRQPSEVSIAHLGFTSSGCLARSPGGAGCQPQLSRLPSGTASPRRSSNGAPAGSRQPNPHGRVPGVERPPPMRTMVDGVAQ